MLSMAKKTFLSLLAVACLFLASGCMKSISDGAVLSKEHVPAHYESTMRYDHFLKIWVSDQEYVPDRWYITIGKFCDDDQYRTRKVGVRQDTYNQAKVGEYINLE